MVDGAQWGSEQVSPPGGANLAQLTRASAATTAGTWIIGDEIPHRE